MNFNEQERRPKWFLFLHNTPEFFFFKSSLLTVTLLTAPSALLRQTLKLFIAGKIGSLINQFIKSH